ncbi:hypothetical protein [Streptomyces sp. NPDC006270]|uniref:hypothetical protein n=1 Tax=Streptomyces sp. NPDC006270 TaxID=3364741 RepID=UPI0036B80825
MRDVLGAGGDGVVDRGQGAGDVEEPVRLGAADAELRGAVRLPAAVPEGRPDAGGAGGAGGAPDVVHRLVQPGRDLPGLLCGEPRPRGFDDVVLVLVAGAHDSIVLRAGGRGQGVRKHGARAPPHNLTPS